MITAEILKKYGMDLATVKAMAKKIQDNPELENAFKQQMRSKGFEGNVEEFYKELEEVLNHGKES